MGRSVQRRRILVVGDSLTVSCEHQLARAAQQSSVDLTINAENGRSVRAIGPILGATGPRSDIVIALGTNDHAMATTVAERTIDSTVSATEARTRLWWVDLALTGGRHLAFNSALERAECRHPELRVIRWSEIVARESGLLTNDGIHLTDAGQDARCGLTANAVFR